MAKFVGEIGYSMGNQEVSPGVWKTQIVVKRYKGDIIRNNVQNKPGEDIIDDVNISNRISIIADRFANDNFPNMKYVTWKNSKWKVTDVEITYPRLILSIGGRYNEESVGSP